MTRKRSLLVVGSLAVLLCAGIAVHAQQRPYIGFAYPAGGQLGTTSELRLGGQGLDGVYAVLVTGSGVTAKLVDYRRRLNNEEVQLLNQQLKELKAATSAVASAMGLKPNASAIESAGERIQRIEQRIAEFVQAPACAAISTLAIVEVSIGANAEPGRREIRLVTSRGVSNPLPFHVGQFPEFSRKPMLTATIQVLGKEARALRQRPSSEVEARITIPCTVNGQIASGEVNRYRFKARKGQKLVISTLARQLVPFIADAVPGWFQPVLTVCDDRRKQLAFSDDYRFQPDPVILFEVPSDGEYVFAITDALYRGREDFVYRITVGELPFITSVFPLGAKTGSTMTAAMKGWNLDGAVLAIPKDTAIGIRTLTAVGNRIHSNPVPFAVDELPDRFDDEPNNTSSNAQKVTLPLVINGRINRRDDWDVFEFSGEANDVVVAEVQARRLDSPLDSIIKLTDVSGKVLAFSDDREDLGAGLNTHHADSWFIAQLPAAGPYFFHIGDTARQGGEAYGYRLRLGAPQPGFELRVVPSSVRIRPNATTPVTVYAQRKDGFTNSIKLELKDPPPGFSAAPVKLASGQNNATLTIKGPPARGNAPESLTVMGTAKIGITTVTNTAVPADDQMQAFLWRHLVPAAELKALAYDPMYAPPPKRVVPAPQAPAVSSGTALVTSTTKTPGGTNATLAAAARPKFTEQQTARRLRELQRLYEDDLLADDFYHAKVAECATSE